MTLTAREFKRDDLVRFTPIIGMNDDGRTYRFLKYTAGGRRALIIDAEYQRMTHRWGHAIEADVRALRPVIRFINGEGEQ